MAFFDNMEAEAKARRNAAAAVLIVYFSPAVIAHGKRTGEITERDGKLMWHEREVRQVEPIPTDGNVYRRTNYGWRK